MRRFIPLIVAGMVIAGCTSTKQIVDDWIRIYWEEPEEARSLIARCQEERRRLDQVRQEVCGKGSFDDMKCQEATRWSWVVSDDVTNSTVSLTNWMTQRGTKGDVAGDIDKCYNDLRSYHDILQESGYEEPIGESAGFHFVPAGNGHVMARLIGE